MISQSVQDSICKQVNNELTAAYLYMSMVAYFEERNLHGMANWMRLQTQEEVQHAQRLFNHVLTRGGHVSLEAIPQPQGEFSSPLEVFQIALAHEQKVTAEINALYELALSEKDYPSQVELQWFITEQVEEESSTSEIVDRLTLIGEDPTGLLMIDDQLGARQDAD